MGCICPAKKEMKKRPRLTRVDNEENSGMYPGSPYYVSPDDTIKDGERAMKSVDAGTILHQNTTVDAGRSDGKQSRQKKKVTTIGTH
jgi:hypothetical protein